MLQIRQGVFETNSSSTHAVSICSAAEWDALMNKTLYINSNLNLLPKEEALIKNEDVKAEIRKSWENSRYRAGEPTEEDLQKELLDWGGYVPYGDFYDNYNYEHYHHRSTVGGVGVVAYGYFGYDY